MVLYSAVHTRSGRSSCVKTGKKNSGERGGIKHLHLSQLHTSGRSRCEVGVKVESVAFRKLEKMSDAGDVGEV